jgi:hypothetical protein
MVKLQDQVTQLSVVCTEIKEIVGTSASAAQPAATASASVDRSKNVITGVEENRDSAIWRQTVDRAVSLAAGHDVPIVDAFRLRRFVQGKNRPILVKLQPVWDYRLILSGSRKLHSHPDFSRKISLSADEPPEVRRQHKFDHLKARAERQNRCVSVLDDGVFSIDGIPVYCRRRGFLIQVYRPAGQLSDNHIATNC